MNECLHEPTPNPGVKCDCHDCRVARSRVQLAIMRQCIRCAGRMATDRDGQFTCEKGNFDCPLLDLWCSVLTREIEPERVTELYVTFIFDGKKQPPKLYPRTPRRAKWAADAVRDLNLEELPEAQAEPVMGGPVVAAEENTGGEVLQIEEADIPEEPAPAKPARRRQSRKASA